jgi:hypothetical protein
VTCAYPKARVPDELLTFGIVLACMATMTVLIAKVRSGRLAEVQRRARLAVARPLVTALLLCPTCQHRHSALRPRVPATKRARPRTEG